ncbi:hypothetical protein [Rhizobium sp. AAP43]|uniref:hypothetical protein n=1 Tax=Rhizobium sp. AAP43 TaxID=1523420 RepID=UPI0012E1DB11|nr:hypothetical protein [Rhizobium sp. AAP43]
MIIWNPKNPGVIYRILIGGLASFHLMIAAPITLMSHEQQGFLVNIVRENIFTFMALSTLGIFTLLFSKNNKIQKASSITNIITFIFFMQIIINSGMFHLAFVPRFVDAVGNPVNGELVRLIILYFSALMYSWVTIFSVWAVIFWKKL